MLSDTDTKGKIMGYIIQRPDGEYDWFTSSESESVAWFNVDEDGTTDQLRHKGYRCVPLAVAEGVR